jgi:hypothetical protein
MGLRKLYPPPVCDIQSVVEIPPDLPAGDSPGQDAPVEELPTPPVQETEQHPGPVLGSDPIIYLLKCEECKNLFRTENPEKKHCSDKCYKRDYMRKYFQTHKNGEDGKWHKVESAVTNGKPKKDDHFHATLEKLKKENPAPIPEPNIDKSFT